MVNNFCWKFEWFFTDFKWFLKLDARNTISSEILEANKIEARIRKATFKKFNLITMEEEKEPDIVEAIKNK